MFIKIQILSEPNLNLYTWYAWKNKSRNIVKIVADVSTQKVITNESIEKAV